MLTELFQRISNASPVPSDDSEVDHRVHLSPDVSSPSPTEEPGDRLVIQNVVASTSIEREVDLAALSDDLPNSEFNPGSFPGIIFRPTTPKSTLLVFRSGTVTVTGAKRIDEVEPAVRSLFRELSVLEIPVPDEPSITIQNIVCSADLRRNLNLDLIALGFGLEHVEYEPEQFPGLIYRLDEPAVVLLLFSSGKVIVAGGKTREAVEEAVTIVKSKLSNLGLLE